MQLKFLDPGKRVYFRNFWCPKRWKGIHTGPSIVQYFREYPCPANRLQSPIARGLYDDLPRSGNWARCTETASRPWLPVLAVRRQLHLLQWDKRKLIPSSELNVNFLSTRWNILRRRAEWRDSGSIVKNGLSKTANRIMLTHKFMLNLNKFSRIRRSLTPNAFPKLLSTVLRTQLQVNTQARGRKEIIARV